MKPTQDIKSAVIKYSKEFKLDPIVVQAIVETESGYNPFAIRYEPSFKWLYSSDEIAFILKTQKEAAIACQRLSIGLMQPMVSVCNELGFRGWFYELFAVELNVMYGCKHLRNLIDRQKLTTPYEYYDAYNSGRANDSIINQSNQSHFMSVYKRLSSN